jgi:hypothetical protein
MLLGGFKISDRDYGLYLLHYLSIFGAEIAELVQPVCWQKLMLSVLKLFNVHPV